MPDHCLFTLTTFILCLLAHYFSTHLSVSQKYISVLINDTLDISQDFNKCGCMTVLGVQVWHFCEKCSTPAVYLLKQRPLQELDLSSYKHLKLITHEQAEVSPWQHLDLLWLHSAIICLEHYLCDTSNIPPGHLHQQRRVSDSVYSRAREVSLYSFKAMLCR